MTLLELGALLIWSAGCGWFACDGARNGAPADWLASVAWPVLLPLGVIYHRWRWGSKRAPRSVYVDTRWWRRGQR